MREKVIEELFIFDERLVLPPCLSVMLIYSQYQFYSPPRINDSSSNHASRTIADWRIANFSQTLLGWAGECREADLRAEAGLPNSSSHR
jgi:hypothetical protein